MQEAQRKILPEHFGALLDKNARTWLILSRGFDCRLSSQQLAGVERTTVGCDCRGRLQKSGICSSWFGHVRRQVHASKFQSSRCCSTATELDEGRIVHLRTIVYGNTEGSKERSSEVLIESYPHEDRRACQCEKEKLT